MKFLIPFFFVGMLFTCNLAFSAVDDKISIVGFVVAFTNEQITLDSGKSRIELPRKYYSKHLAVGNRISIEVPRADVSTFKVSPLKK